MLKKLKSLKGKFGYDDSEMPFLEHLEEFRKTVMRCLLALVIGMAVSFFFVEDIIAVLRAPAEKYIEKSAEDIFTAHPVSLRIEADSLEDAAIVEDETGARYYDVQAHFTLPEEVKTKENRGTIRLQFSEPAAAVKMWIVVTFFGGILVSLPFLVFFIGLFVMPGVRDVERKVMTRVAAFSGGLFLTGIAMGYFITLPLALDLMLRVGGRLGGESIWFYNKYIAFSLQLLLAFGVAFQMPVVILILGRMGLVSSSQLREKRRHVIVAMFIVAMLLTPPDPLTQVIMALPLILLYEFCIWFLHLSGNREAPPNEVENEGEPEDAAPDQEAARDSAEESTEEK